MAEIKTRIALKYDSLGNWQSSVFNGTDSSKWLKAGEVAIVTLGSDVESTHPTNASNQHPLLFKVGTGVHKFDDLAWASALAADVYDWAKKPTLDVNDLPTLPLQVVDPDAATKKFITGISYADNKLTITRSDVALEDISDKEKIALSADMGAVANLTTTAKTVVGAINEHDVEIGDLTALNTTNKSNLVTAINEALQAVEVGGTGSVVTVVKDTTSDGSLATYTVKQGGNAVGDKIEVVIDSDLTDRVDSIYDFLGDIDSALENGVDLQNYLDNVDMNSTVGVETTEGDEETTYTFSQGLQSGGGYSRELASISVVDAYKKSETENLVQGAKDYTDAQLENYTKTDDLPTDLGDFTNNAGYVLISEVPTEANIKSIAADEINRLIKASDDEDDHAIENIANLVDYVEKNAGDIAQLVTDVNTANTNASNAVSTANTASSIANEAKGLAEGAVSTANDAKTAATEAQNSASASAQAAAGSASNAATDAQIASNAQVAAEGFASNAENSANAAAESASNASESAAGAFANASNAEAAQGKAEAAQAAAEAAQEAAEAAQAAAEASNTSATAIATEAKTTADGAKTAADAATNAVAGLKALAYKDKVGSDDFADEIFVFNCGTASTVI